MTGLYSGRYLMGTLATEVQRSRRLRRPFSVLLADVDHFKQYNDTHGHPAGDAALARVADILRKTTRGVDCVARYGGEEFLVMLLETTVGTAAIVAERIRARMAIEEFAGGRITISIGVAGIGRASCRGRGEISGGAGSLKKKKEDRRREWQVKKTARI